MSEATRVASVSKEVDEKTRAYDIYYLLTPGSFHSTRRTHHFCLPELWQFPHWTESDLVAAPRTT